MSRSSKVFDPFRSRTKYLFDSDSTVKHSIDLMARTGEFCGLLSEHTITNTDRNPVATWISENQVNWEEEQGNLLLSYLETIVERYGGPISPRPILSWKLAAKQHDYQVCSLGACCCDARPRRFCSLGNRTNMLEMCERSFTDSQYEE